MDEPQQALNSVEYNIDNIIESAVDELLQQKVTAHNDYDDIDVLLLSLCRLCAKEATQLVKISDVYWLRICDLKITGIDGTGACPCICSSCMSILEDIQQFRRVCEEGQKRILAMLTQQNMLPDFLNLDFTESKKDPTVALDPPLVDAHYHDYEIEDSIKQNIQRISSCEEKNDDNYAIFANPKDPAPVAAPEIPSIREHKTNPPRRAALNVRELVKSLASAEGEADFTDSSESDEFTPTGGSERRHSTDESDFAPLKAKGKAGPTSSVKRKSKPIAVAGANGKKRMSHKLESRRRIVEGCLEWVCLDCEIVFESCLKLKKHRQNCELVGSERSKRFGSFACETCGAVLNTFASLCLHRYKHDPATVRGNGKKELKEKICHVCGKIFRSVRSLNKHLIIHAGDKKHVCQICDKSFARKCYLRRHLEVHSGTKEHECTTCGKKCTTSKALRNHRETHKPNYLRHQCTICSKRFAHPYQLREHMMIHTEEYPYSCETCNALFRKPCQLNRHMEKGHAPPEAPQPERPGEMVDFDDLIVYQPEDDLVAMLDTIPEEMPQLPQSAPVVDTLTQEQLFSSDHLLDEETREFTVQCFPEADEADHEMYRFMEF